MFWQGEYIELKVVHHVFSSRLFLLALFTFQHSNYKHHDTLITTTTTNNLQKIINDDKPVLKVKSAEFGYNVHHTLLDIFSLPSLHNYDVEMPNFTFNGRMMMMMKLN